MKFLPPLGPFIVQSVGTYSHLLRPALATNGNLDDAIKAADVFHGELGCAVRGVDQHDIVRYHVPPHGKIPRPASREGL